MTTTTFPTTRYNRANMPPIRGLAQLRDKIAHSPERLKQLLRELLEETKTRWVFEAKKRAPLDTGRLVNSIEGAVEEIGDVLYAAVGTNVPYASFVEWGTTRIAGGRVLALGMDPEVTDAEAIRDWPEKSKRPSGDDQMPWLRPSWWAIEPWFREQLGYILLLSLTGGNRA